MTIKSITIYCSSSDKLSNKYYQDAEEISNKKALMGALSLYLDFINLFIMLLRLFGQRR